MGTGFMTTKRLSKARKVLSANVSLVSDFWAVPMSMRMSNVKPKRCQTESDLWLSCAGDLVALKFQRATEELPVTSPMTYEKHSIPSFWLKTFFLGKVFETRF